MFKKNIKHQQPALISAISDLPEKQRIRLENSWAGAFYQEFYRRIMILSYGKWAVCKATVA